MRHFAPIVFSIGYKPVYLCHFLLAGLYLMLISPNLSAQQTTPPTQFAKRIITLSPHLTEMVYSAGAGHALVGTVKYSNFPEAAKAVPRVGDFNALNFERILQLKPDLVLSWQSATAINDLHKLKQLGIEVWQSDIAHLTDIPQQILAIGQKAGTQQAAQITADHLNKLLSELAHRYQNRPPVSTFYQVWDNPLITLNGENFVSQGIALCGGRNIFHNLSQIAPQVNLESLILLNPSLILLGGPAQNQATWKTQWQHYPQIQAVKTQQIVSLNADHFQRPTARFIEALPQLCHIIDQTRHAIAPNP